MWLKLFAYLHRFLFDFAVKWLRNHVDERTYLIVVSVTIGAVAGLAAVLLKQFVRLIKYLLDGWFEPTEFNFLYLVYPMAGIALAVLYVKRIHAGKLDKGLSRLLLALSRNSARLPRSATYSHMVSSALTVSFGGSAGLEAPIVLTGSAIGSNVAKELRAQPRFRNLFIACGAAAGISAVFNSPIAGVIFAFEVLLPELTVASFIPLLMASATATIVSKLLFYETIFAPVLREWQMGALPFYIVLGLLCGCVAAYMTRTTFRLEARFKKIKLNARGRVIFGGLALGILIFLFPPLFGEGYETINDLFRRHYPALLNNSLFYEFKHSPWALVAFATAMIFIKVIATALTIGAGGNGGIFAPSLFTGALTGFVLARSTNLLTGWGLNEVNFIAIGMAGVISGVVHAPLTGIFLIAEITGGYALIVPLMIVSSLAFFVARYIEPYSVYTKPLAEENRVHVASPDDVLLQRIETTALIEVAFASAPYEGTLRDLLHTIKQSKRNIFPVVDQEGKFRGIVLLDDIRDQIFDPSTYDNIRIAKLMQIPADTVMPGEAAPRIMEKFEKHGVWRLPVVEGDRFVGFISKSRLLNAYREVLVGRQEGV